MANTALVLVSHGSFAQGALEAAEMIVGQQENCRVVSLTPAQGADDLVAALEAAMDALDTSGGTVMITDLFGGTPSNAVGRLVCTNEALSAFSGLSLPVLLEYFSSRDLPAEALAQRLEECHSGAFQNISALLEKGDDSNGDRTGSY